MAERSEPVRARAFGQDGRLSVVDRFGIWLSGRAIRRHVKSFAGLRVGDFGCGYEARFTRTVLGEVREAVLVDVALGAGSRGRPRVPSDRGPPAGRARRARRRVARRRALHLDARAPVGARSGAAELPPRAPARRGVPVNVPSWRGKRFLELSAFRLHLSPAAEMDDHKRYYDPRDLWPMLVAGGLPAERHQVLSPQVRPQHVRGLPRARGPMSSFAESYLAETAAIATQLDTAAVERLATELAAVRDRGGRLFVLGVGGSAAHASHAACDFRKLCAFEAYAPTDNVAELTARTNDDGWEDVFADVARGVTARSAVTRCSSSRSAAATQSAASRRTSSARSTSPGVSGRGPSESSVATAATSVVRPTSAS